MDESQQNFITDTADLFPDPSRQELVFQNFQKYGQKVSNYLSNYSLWCLTPSGNFPKGMTKSEEPPLFPIQTLFVQAFPHVPVPLSLVFLYLFIFPPSKWPLSCLDPVLLKYTFFTGSLLFMLSMCPNHLWIILFTPFYTSLHLHIFPCYISHIHLQCSHYPILSLQMPLSSNSLLQHVLMIAVMPCSTPNCLIHMLAFKGEYYSLSLSSSWTHSSLSLPLPVLL